MDLSVIIVNWNSKDYVRQCLASLFHHTAASRPEVIVVDGASFDGCDAMLAAEFPTVRFVQSPTNVGFGRANNLGVEHATRTHLLLLNPDTELTENAPAMLLEWAARLPDAGAIGCRLLNKDGVLQTSCVQSFPTVLNQLLDSEFLRGAFPKSSLWGMAPLLGDRDQVHVAEAISGACILVRRDRFLAVGGFTPSYFMYGEDLDLCCKLQRAGFRNYFVPQTSVIHFGGGSSSRAPSDFSTVMMRQSVQHFLRLNQGAGAAALYRATLGGSAVLRLMLIGPMLLFRRGVVQHGRDSFRKWKAILRWACGFPTATAKPKVNAPSSLPAPETT